MLLILPITAGASPSWTTLSLKQTALNTKVYSSKTSSFLMHLIKRLPEITILRGLNSSSQSLLHWCQFILPKGQ